MTRQERDVLRDAASAVRLRDASGPSARDDRWTLQTSNSFRRIGTVLGDGNVLCGTKHPRDGHPDLLAAPGVLDYIVAAQPDVVVGLLDDLDAAERMQRSANKLAQRILEIERRLDKARDAVSTAVEKISRMDRVTVEEVRKIFDGLRAAVTEEA